MENGRETERTHDAHVHEIVVEFAPAEVRRRRAPPSRVRFPLPDIGGYGAVPEVPDHDAGASPLGGVNASARSVEFGAV